MKLLLQRRHRQLHNKRIFLTMCENCAAGVKMTPFVVQGKLRKLDHVL